MGAEIKYAGYDAIIVKGKADRFVYLCITPNRTEVKDAGFLRGKGTFQSELVLKRELKDEEVNVLSIGPAGENLVKFACITSEFYRQQGRGGYRSCHGQQKPQGNSRKGRQGYSRT